MSDKLNLETIWTECEALYPANKDVCLELQDKYDVNVNLLLLALYLDQRTTFRYQPTQWKVMLDIIHDWELNILKPYRELRRNAKTMIEQSEYQQMLNVELMMERKSQQTLSKLLINLTPVDEGSNLSGYLNLYDNNLEAIIELKA
ncbi:TIGR02444 family protein [Shewanella sp. 202IG2-18]|uniref:TIGR02444 family protein n=1 Tax=Parashewanella hymeniacidonis TaxID=2807618 RepID=UPI0019614B37|nr:TIGR02444 family protein [Parashewanella hymeniacidonis]MBM7070831.1 TIGR02444 family protein [Parashewanella hymeniacidonis]